MPPDLNTLSNKKILEILKRSSIYSDQLLRKYRLNILHQYKGALDNIRAEIAKMYERYGDEITLQQMNQYNRLKILEDQIQLEIRKADRRFKDITKQAISDIFSSSYYLAGFAFESTLGIRMGFSLLNQKKIEAAILNPMDRITWINRATAHGRKLNQDIRVAITQGLIQGKSYPEVARAIKQNIDIASTRLVRVTQTETHRAHILGQLDAHNKLAASAEDIGFKIQKQWLATLDERTRDNHRELDGQIADEDGLFHISGFTTEGPGLFGIAEEDINCFLPNTKIYADSKINKVYRRWYEGKILEIKTAPGINFSVTPNHPILTNRGWVAAKFLTKDFNLINNIKIKNIFFPPNPNPKDTPTVFNEIFSFFNVIPSGFIQRIPGIKPQFHGDGFESNVDIVSINSFLRTGIQSGFSKLFNKIRFTLTNFTARFFFGYGLFYSSIGKKDFRFVPNYRLSIQSIFNIFRFSPARHHQSISNSLISDNEIQFNQPLSNSSPIHFKSFGNLIFRNTGIIKILYFVKRKINRHIKIHSIIEKDYSGYVYNLETDNNTYKIINNFNERNTNSITVHNCRCDIITHIEGFDLEKRKDNESKDFIGFKNYEEWAAEKKII